MNEVDRNRIKLGKKLAEMNLRWSQALEKVQTKYTREHEEYEQVVKYVKSGFDYCNLERVQGDDKEVVDALFDSYENGKVWIELDLDTDELIGVPIELAETLYPDAFDKDESSIDANTKKILAIKENRIGEAKQNRIV